MGSFVDNAFLNQTGTNTTETSVGNYNPTVSGNLTGVYPIVSVVTQGYLRLRCSTFGGVDLVTPLQYHQAGVMAKVPSNLPVKAGVQIAILYRYSATPTSPVLDIYVEISS